MRLLPQIWPVTHVGIMVLDVLGNVLQVFLEDTQVLLGQMGDIVFHLS